MAVFLTGDIHGLIDDPDRFEVWNFPEGENLTRNDYVIVLGDFGMPFDMMESDDDLRKPGAKRGRRCSSTGTTSASIF